jgi:UDP-N-acetylmuramoyl-L-alanyl-D-glutamate--2,6-diaminopimelate ligase
VEKIKKENFFLAESIKLSPLGSYFNIRGTPFELKLFGDFNIYNALAAVCVGVSQGIDIEISAEALKGLKKIEGRMEKITEAPFSVIVDYAFTPNALEKVYAAIKRDIRPSKLVCVLGACGGGRDKWKRPVLGEISAKYCDEIIITDEDPYDEDPLEIIDQVAEGAGQKAEKIVDRREAIRRALTKAKKGDAVIITGKGSEPSICLKDGIKLPWDDRKVVREELERLNVKK